MCYFCIDASTAQLVADVQRAEGESRERAQQLKDLQAELATARAEVEAEKDARSKEEKYVCFFVFCLLCGAL